MCDVRELIDAQIKKGRVVCVYCLKRGKLKIYIKNTKNKS